jgi:hypothetical protein
MLENAFQKVPGSIRLILHSDQGWQAVPDAAIPEDAQRKGDQAEYVQEGKLLRQQCDGELLWHPQV